MALLIDSGVLGFLIFTVWPVCTYECPHCRNVAPMNHLNNNIYISLPTPSPVTMPCEVWCVEYWDLSVLAQWPDGGTGPPSHSGHFSVARQTAAGQHDGAGLTLNTVTSLTLKTLSSLVSFISDLMESDLVENIKPVNQQESKCASFKCPLVAPLWRLLWNSWLILNGNKGFGSIKLSSKSKVYSTRSCSFFGNLTSNASKL